jgi:hypothetical protein
MKIIIMQKNNWLFKFMILLIVFIEIGGCKISEKIKSFKHNESFIEIVNDGLPVSNKYGDSSLVNIFIYRILNGRASKFPYENKAAKTDKFDIIVNGKTYKLDEYSRVPIITPPNKSFTVTVNDTSNYHQPLRLYKFKPQSKNSYLLNVYLIYDEFDPILIKKRNNRLYPF